MTAELMPDDTGREDERAAKCSTCPREGALRLLAVPNYAVNGGQLESPSPWVIETVSLCDYCALLRGDVL